jgi:hypothetical protein
VGLASRGSVSARLCRLPLLPLGLPCLSKTPGKPRSRRQRHAYQTCRFRL